MDERLNNNSLSLICDPDLVQTISVLNKLKNQLCNIKFNRIIESKVLEINAKLAANKAGVAILPETVAKEASNGQLKLLENSPIYKDDVCICFRHENRSIRAIQEIINMLKYNFSNN